MTTATHRPGLPDPSEIRRRRLHLGLSQGALAKAAGLSQSMVAKIEREKVEPSYRSIVALFGALDQHEIGEAHEVLVRDLMTPSLVSVAPSTLLTDAAHLLRKNSISQVPVLENEFNVGALTDRMIVECLADPGRMARIARLKVRQVMQEPFPQLDGSAPRQLAAALLRHVPAVLVTHQGRLSGILTQSDLFKEL